MFDFVIFYTTFTVFKMSGVKWNIGKQGLSNNKDTLSISEDRV